MGDEERPVARDDNGAHIVVVTRRAAYQKGTWHRWFQGWIVAEEAGRRDVLFQHRAPPRRSIPPYST